MTDRQAKAAAMSSMTMRIARRLARSTIVRWANYWGWKITECHRTSRTSKTVVVIMESVAENRGRIHSFRL